MDPRQRLYLDAMGIQVWERREALPPAAEAAAPAVEPVPARSEPLEAPAASTPLETKAIPATAPVAPAAPAVEAKRATPVVAVSSPEVAVSPVRDTKKAPTPQVDDDIPAWLDEAPPVEIPAGFEETGEFDAGDFFHEEEGAPWVDVATLDWPALRERVAACTACDELVANRTQTVFGVGNQQAEWMVIGEAPGADEDAQGEPFVGKAGQLLNAMLGGIGLKRQQVYIANVLKCRPPNNRDPKPEEAAACEPFLKRQIALIQPRLILVVGRIAAQNLLKVDTPIGKLRGHVHRLEGGIPVVVTYHPAYLLRSPSEKRKAWDDLCLARQTLQGAR